MSFEDHRLQIETRMNTNWTTTPIAFENIEFTPPTNSPWVSLFIYGVDSFTLANRSGSYRDTGLIAVKIHVPIGSGSKVAMGYADTIATIWRASIFNNIRCGIPSINRLGEFDGWYQTIVTTPFNMDQIYT